MIRLRRHGKARALRAMPKVRFLRLAKQALMSQSKRLWRQRLELSCYFKGIPPIVSIISLVADGQDARLNTQACLFAL